MRRAPRPSIALAASVLTAAFTCGCSLALDWDALVEGDEGGGGQGGAGGAVCGGGPCAPSDAWRFACHSVYVTKDEAYAYSTTYNAGLPDHPPGLYRIDLSIKDPNQTGERLTENVLPHAGLAGDGDSLVFATDAPDGSVWRVPITSSKPAAEPVSAAVDFEKPFAVAIAGTYVYWTEKVGRVGGVTATGDLADEWMFDGSARYLAIEGGAVYATIEGQGGQVARMAMGGGMIEVITPYSGEIRGIAVKSLLRAGEEVVHVFFVTADGAKVATPGADSTFDIRDLGGNDPTVTVPGEIVTDDTHVYWTMRRSTGQDIKGGHIFRKALDGEGPTEIIAPNEPNPNGITVAGESLYWCTSNGLRQLKVK